MREAHRAGAVLPPVVVDEKTGKVIDGWHRVEMFEGLYGPDYEIPVTLKSYRNRQAMLEDAIRLNVGRGLDLSRWDVTRCLTLAEEVGLPLSKLAESLQWQEPRLAKYRDSRMGKTLDDRKLALKRSLRHKMGQPLTPNQEAANDRLSGMPASFHANQLILFLQNDLMPDDDPQLVVHLHQLGELIAQWLDGREMPTDEAVGE